MSDRSALRCLSSLLACGLLLPAALVAQRDFSAVEFEAEKVAGAVHMLASGVGGNIGVSAGEDGVLIVDDQFEPLADKIRAAVAEISAGDLAFVLNTHFHGDHTGSNVVFGAEALIVAHQRTRERLSQPSERGGRTTPAQPKQALPVITFADSTSVHFNGEEIRLQHYPNAHTDTDVAVHFVGSGVAHLGDLFFAGRFPFVDVASGGNALGLERAIRQLLDELPGDTRLIPGHGPQSDLEGLREYHAMLEQTIAQVRAGVERGDSLEQLQRSGVDERWSTWAWGFIDADRWIEIVYSSLKTGD